MIRLALVITLMVLNAGQSYAQFCGIPPIPPPGCQMVCIDGRWHSLCR